MNNEVNSSFIAVILLLAALTLPLKIVGLWRSARNGQKWWFAGMLILNTVGILELTYLFYFSKPKDKKKSQD
jgi:methionyl-tRNA synthetase